jgi:glycosyltransferase involved in cell wall biosynthesis
MQELDGHYEIIIGEDASTDSSRALIHTYEKQHPDRIIVIRHKQNVGMMANFESVLNACRGKYIAICEGDDFWLHPGKLQQQVNTLERNPFLDLCYHPVRPIREFDKLKTELINAPIEQTGGADVISFKEVVLGDGAFISTPSILFRRAILSAEVQEIIRGSPVGDFIIQLFGSIRGGAAKLPTIMAAYRKHHPESWNTQVTADSALRRKFEERFLLTLGKVMRQLPRSKSALQLLIIKRLFKQISKEDLLSRTKAEWYARLILKSLSTQIGFVQRSIIWLSVQQPVSVAIRLTIILHSHYRSSRLR